MIDERLPRTHRALAFPRGLEVELARCTATDQAVHDLAARRHHELGLVR